jgi:hypothetical protein
VFGGDRSPEEPRAGGAPRKPGERLVLAAHEITAMSGDDVEKLRFALWIAQPHQG